MLIESLMSAFAKVFEVMRRDGRKERCNRARHGVRSIGVDVIGLDCDRARQLSANCIEPKSQPRAVNNRNQRCVRRRLDVALRDRIEPDDGARINSVPARGQQQIESSVPSPVAAETVVSRTTGSIVIVSICPC
jgi:hypothetical protein